MATSGTYNYQPSLGQSVLYALSRVGIKRTEITQEHMESARFAANLVLADWANEQVNLWDVDLQSTALVTGQSTYSVDPATVLILDAYITKAGLDRIIYPISRTDYAGFPDKVTPGTPTTFWFDKLISPTVTLWQPPDSNGPYVLNYYRVRQVQDAALPNGLQVEIPYRFLKAFNDALACEMAIIYAPDRLAPLEQAAMRSWQKAAQRDTEDVPIFISPSMSGYYR